MTIQLDTALERLLNYIRNWRMGLRKFSPFQDSLVEAELFCTSRILPDLLSVSMKLHFVWSRYIKSDTIICRPPKDYLWWYRTVLRFWDPSLYGMWNVYGEGDKASTGVVNVIRYAAHRWNLAVFFLSSPSRLCLCSSRSCRIWCQARLNLCLVSMRVVRGGYVDPHTCNWLLVSRCVCIFCHS